MEATEIHHSVHIPQWKKDEIKEIVDNVHSHKVTGIVDVRGVPADALQQMRQKLRGTVAMKMIRNTLTTIAFDSLPEDDKARELAKYVDGQIVLVYTNSNPFKLYKLLEGTKTKAPAKSGDTAPADVAVSKGPTSFKPGPIVGEMQQAGIPAGIEGGKVVIKSDKVVVKKGDKFTAKQAEILGRLEIFPMEIGLNLKAVIEGHTLYMPSDLSMDETELRNMFAKAYGQAMSLSLEAGIANKDTIVPLIQKSVRESKALAVNAPIFEKDVIDMILSKAEAEMLSVAKEAKAKNADSLDEELKSKV
ncbi:acidic ribosomal protein P0 homolog [Methanocella paludicola SANAE]|uniref:Large ribosomal subunit protein uL10 n=1 Tax=Methanocella paludicola (strain DSM 17711 / JCM 13418 / NBRC 101707 / SANAE) TaxID=304371 RepID=D1Z0C6_METPS|nr:50S ribosomal protein L10 [Methanocella paludicola]BAI62148.1 acidic ribosomal protein P0 homolog [Methanocella paludicola SANAE]